MNNKLNLILLISINLIYVVNSLSQPNILLLFPDQWRWDWIGKNLSLNTNYSYVDLNVPNLHNVINDGTIFTTTIVQSPLCAPSRACLAGGRLYDEAGVKSNFQNDYPVNHTTFYKVLRDNGYHVMTTGKDDLTKKTQPGPNGNVHALELGFSDWLRCSGKDDVLNGGPHEPYGYLLHNQTTKDGKNLYAKQSTCFKETCCKGLPDSANGPGGYYCPNHSPLPINFYEDNNIGANGLKLLERRPKDKPFFLQVNFAGPHPPFVITKAMAETVRNRTFPVAVDNEHLGYHYQQLLRQNYAAEIENLDKWFGTYIDYIDNNVDSNTIICIGADHGEELGDHDKFGKLQPWMGSSTVPLTCRGPNIKKQQINHPVAQFDLSATFIDYAGGSKPTGMTSESLRCLFEGTCDKNRDYISSGLYDWRMVVQVHNNSIYKLVCCKNKVCDGQPHGVHTVAHGNGYVILFNISSNYHEKENVATTNPDLVNLMAKLLPTGWCHAS